MKKILSALAVLAHFAFDSVAWSLRKFWAREEIELAANIFTEGTHQESKTVTLDAAVTVRNLLYKKGASDPTVAVCAATADVPLGTIDDEGAIGDEVALLILGKGPTKKMVAVEAIAVGEECFTTTTGKVQNRPSAAATYWQVGVALTAASGDDVVLEVADCVPIKLVISA